MEGFLVNFVQCYKVNCNNIHFNISLASEFPLVQLIIAPLVASGLVSLNIHKNIDAVE